METRIHSDAGSFLVQRMKISLPVIGCIPLLGGLACYSLLMAYGMAEEDGLLFRKRITTEEGGNPMTTVASHQEQYRDGKMMFEIIRGPLGFGVSFKYITNPPTEPTQTAKVPEPSNPEATFITATRNINDSKEGAPLGMAKEHFMPVKFGISTFKYQG